VFWIGRGVSGGLDSIFFKGKINPYRVIVYPVNWPKPNEPLFIRWNHHPVPATSFD